MPNHSFSPGPAGRALVANARHVCAAPDETPAPQAEEEEQEIPLGNLPQKVRDAASMAVVGAKWETTAYLIKDEEGQFYELEGVNRSGRIVVVSVSTDGELMEIETEIRPREVPQAVREAVRQKLERFRVVAAYETRDTKEVTGYVLEGRRPRMRGLILVSVSPDGQTIEVEELADEPLEPAEAGDTDA